jgi:hypothetical protein
MDRYVFIDESGDLGQFGSKYFVITAIWTEDIAQFDRLIKNMRRNKFKKELKDVIEIKANKSSRSLRMYLLNSFAEMKDAYVQCTILSKQKLHSSYLKNNKDKLYNYVCGHLSIIAINAKHLIIRIDKSKAKQQMIVDFNEYFERKLKDSKWDCSAEIYHSYSQSWSGLQIADMVSWAIFQKFEHDIDEYFKIIEKKANISHVWK